MQNCLFFNEINKKTILCTNHLRWKENSLATNDWDPVELSWESRHQFPQWNLRPPQNYYLFWISHLVGKSSFKCRTEYFLPYVIGEMFRTNELFMNSVDLAFVYLFLVCDYWFVMTCHDTKDNAGLKDFIPVSKTNNNHKK